MKHHSATAMKVQNRGYSFAERRKSLDLLRIMSAVVHAVGNDGSSYSGS